MAQLSRIGLQKAGALTWLLLVAVEMMLASQAGAQVPAAAQAPSPPAADFESEWHWLQTEFPEASAYTPHEKVVLPIRELMAWAGKANTIDIFDWGCRRIRVQRTEDAFQGRTDVQEVLDPGGQTKSVSYDEASFGSRVEVIDGSSISYRKVKHGWVETQGQGFSSIRFESLLLSKVSRDAAWYGSAEGTLTMECHERTNEVMTCASSGTRTCSHCSRWGLGWHHFSGPLVGRHHSVVEVTLASTQQADCTKPCAQAETPASVRRAESVLNGHSFLVDMTTEHPLIFRTREACRRYRHEHQIPADDSRSW